MNKILDNLINSFKKKPNQHALIDSRGTVSYLELLNTVYALRDKLISLELNQGDRVAVSCDKNNQTVELILAIFSLGLTFVPLAKDIPRNRRDKILNDSKPKILISDHLNTGDTDIPVHRWPFNLKANKKRKQFDGSDMNSINLDSSAYIIYTSGSTGTPKGVVISYRSLFDFIKNTINYQFYIDSNSKCIGLSPINFDVFIEDTIVPIMAGATLYVYDKPFYPAYALELINTFKITHFVCVSPLLTLFAECAAIDEIDISHVKLIVTGADVLKPSVIKKLISKAPDLVINNGYGPTEFTCSCTTFSINKANFGHYSSFPLGKIFPGQSFILIDSENNKIDEYCKNGELLLSGSQLMKGYLLNGILNDSCLVKFDGKNYYKTGDICYLNKNNEICYVGRNDSQVKVYGVRIDLREIEFCSEQYPNVIEACAYKVDDNKLALVLATNNHESFNQKAFNIYLRSNLIDAMIPNQIILLDQLPRMSSGKINHSQLKINLLKLDKTSI